MTKRSKQITPVKNNDTIAGYDTILSGLVELLESARRASARSVNAIMTTTYWEIGRRIVEYEQGGQARAEYGSELLQRLSADLTARFGRGFSVDNLETMRLFYLAYPPADVSEKAMQPAGKSETASRKFDVANLACFKNMFTL